MATHAQQRHVQRALVFTATHTGDANTRFGPTSTIWTSVRITLIKSTVSVMMHSADQSRARHRASHGPDFSRRRQLCHTSHRDHVRRQPHPGLSLSGVLSQLSL
jgi:hypothetical protein